MSTTEERAQMLYDKALTELNTYLEDMKTKPPQEIINSAYQIVNKQDLLMILESAEFTPAELNVLNELEHPLQVMYEEWLPVEDRHMEELRDSVQSYDFKHRAYLHQKLSWRVHGGRGHRACLHDILRICQRRFTWHCRPECFSGDDGMELSRGNYLQYAGAGGIGQGRRPHCEGNDGTVKVQIMGQIWR